jgi:sugar phosphate isomerase/epimerase
MSKAVMSTFAFAGRPVEEIIELAKENNFTLEFSSGLPFHPGMEKIFLAAPVPRFAHNYFPAPEIPFVLNLASKDESIRNKSIDHCVHGIRLSHAVKAPFFSAHAGFCVDPKPSELGVKLERVKSFDRKMHWNIFVESIKEVLKRTKDIETGFLLENNVLPAVNLYEDGSNPAFCVDGPEMKKLVNEIDDPRAGILLDTAHLKVSANTLGFNPVEHAQLIIASAKCVHHSDNDGIFDTNQPFDSSYWFLPLMKQAEHAIHVLEVRKQNVDELMEMERLLFASLN